MKLSKLKFSNDKTNDLVFKVVTLVILVLGVCYSIGYFSGHLFK